MKQKFNCAFITSYERDNETELDFAQARYYAINLGRFNSVDPINISLERVTDPQRINLYIYSRNNPLKFIDDNGEDIKLAEGMTKKEVEALIDAMVAAYVTTGGNAFFNEAAAATDMTLTLAVGDLSSHDSPGMRTYGLTRLDSNDKDITITLDLNSRDKAEQDYNDFQSKSAGKLRGLGDERTVPVRPGSAKDYAKHETAHGIDAKRDPSGYKKAKKDGEKVTDYDKNPAEIRRREIQKREMNEKVKDLKNPEQELRNRISNLKDYKYALEEKLK